jgi:hypothetical protein
VANRFVFVSCCGEERGRAEVLELCAFVKSAGSEVVWAEQAGAQGGIPEGTIFSRQTLSEIERCDVFVAVVTETYRTGTELAAEVLYADGLRKLREFVSVESRPRVLALSVDGALMPGISEHIAVSWMAGPTDRALLLESP